MPACSVSSRNERAENWQTNCGSNDRQGAEPVSPSWKNLRCTQRLCGASRGFHHDFLTFLRLCGEKHLETSLPQLAEHVQNDMLHDEKWQSSSQILCSFQMLARGMPMMAIIANLPLAISAESFLVFSAGSAEVSTFQPKSPAAAGVPAVWS